MTQRELHILNYEAALPILKTLKPTHRYLKAFFETMISEILPRQGMDEGSKELVITEMESYIQRIKKMTDKQFNESPCGTCAVFHDPRKPTIHYLLGDIRLIEKPLEFNGGETADLEQRIEQKIDGKWVDKGVLE